MRCEICDYDEEIGANLNVNIFASNRPRRVTISKQDGKALCTECRGVVAAVQEDWWMEEVWSDGAYGDYAKIRDKRLDKHSKVVQSKNMNLTEEVRVEPEQEPGEPGDLEDTVPELQDAGERHK